MATSPRFTKTLVLAPTTVLTDTTLTTILAANATYDQRVTGIVVTSDDTSAQTIKLFLNDGTTSTPIGQVSVGIAAGTSTTVAPVGLMASLPSSFRELDANGVSILNIPKTAYLQAQMAAVTNGKKFYVWTKAELYD